MKQAPSFSWSLGGLPDRTTAVVWDEEAGAPIALSGGVAVPRGRPRSSRVLEQPGHGSTQVQEVLTRGSYPRGLGALPRPAFFVFQPLPSSSQDAGLSIRKHFQFNPRQFHKPRPWCSQSTFDAVTVATRVQFPSAERFDGESGSRGISSGSSAYFTRYLEVIEKSGEGIGTTKLMLGDPETWLFGKPG